MKKYELIECIIDIFDKDTWIKTTYKEYFIVDNLKNTIWEEKDNNSYESIYKNKHKPLQVLENGWKEFEIANPKYNQNPIQDLTDVFNYSWDEFLEYENVEQTTSIKNITSCDTLQECFDKHKKILNNKNQKQNSYLKY